MALPDIGEAFDSSQTTLNLIAVGYSLGLAASVLYLGAVGDRHGRKLMLVAGMALSIPACLLAAYAPSDVVLFGARVLGGLSAGMAYPTTLALIAALWSGPARTRSIALWSAIGGAIAALGPLASGFVLQYFWWGSVFLITLPIALIALVMAYKLVPAHVNETTDPVDNLGGILSVVLVAALILAINFAPIPNEMTLVLSLAAIALAAAIAFVIRQRKAANPLYDLHIAGRRVFWVAACAGIIVFGTLMGAAFVGQQFLQNILGYSTLASGASILPGGRVHGRRRAAVGQARRVTRRDGSRCSPGTSSASSASSRCSSSGRRARPTWRSAWPTRSSASASGSRARRLPTRSRARSRSNAQGWHRERPTSNETSAAR